MEAKVCSLCGGEPQPVENFYVKDPVSGRRFADCKACHAKRNAARYQCVKDVLSDAAKAKYAANLPESRKRNREYRRKWRAANPEAEKAIQQRVEARRRENGKRKAYREATRERRLQYGALYRDANRDLLRLKDAEYREQRRDILRERSQQWRQANPEDAAAIAARWKRANPDVVNAATHRRRARIQGCAEHYTAAEWAALKAACHHTCLCCGRQEPEIKLTVDHVIPVSFPDTSNAISNIQPLCFTCNNRKHDRAIDYRGPLVDAGKMVSESLFPESLFPPEDFA